MGARKIVEWPKYKKTGSPTEKKQRRTQHVIDRIFTELLPLTGGGKQKRSGQRSYGRQSLSSSVGGRSASEFHDAAG